MSELSTRISALSPEKQRLLELIRRKEKDRPEAPPQEAARPRSEPFSLVSDADRSQLPPGLEDAYPLTMVQLGMLYHMELTPDSPAPAYHNVNSLHIKAPFEAEVFQRAVDRLVAGNEVLRTCFDLTSYSEPLQLLHREARLEVRVSDLRHLPPEEQERVLADFIREQNRQLVDLAKPPLVHYYVHRRSDETFQFTLTEPHAISDGWSTNSSLVELVRTYLAMLRGETPPERPPLSTRYRDFVALEREALTSAEFRDFWSRKLAGHSVVRLPRWPAHLRPASAAGVADRKPTVPVPRPVVQGLLRLMRTAGVPFKSITLTAHLKVMSLLNGGGEAVTGLATNGRPEEADGDRIHGLFLNTLPLQLRLPAGTWVDLVHAAMQAEVELMPYRRYPLAALQRLRGGQILFESAFSSLHFHNFDQNDLVGGIEVLMEDNSDWSVTHFPLEATFQRMPPTGLVLTLELNDPDLCEEQGRLFQGYYLRVLESMAADPWGRHDQQSFLSEREEHQILVQWNPAARGFPRGLCIHQLFEARVDADPGAVAVVCGGRRLTYGEVEEQANRLAHRLRALGVGPGVSVGLYLSRAPEMIPALLGVLKAGGAYLPVETNLPRERAGLLLASMEVPCVLTQTPHLPALEEMLPGLPRLRRLICLDEPGDLAAEPAARPEPLAGPEDLAYTIFTSGSTGTPKGVMVRHRPVLNLIDWVNREMGIGPRDRVLFITSLAFDLSVYDVFGLLAAGGSIQLATAEDLAEPERLVRLLRDEPVTFWDSAPAALQQLVPLFPAAPGLEASRLRLVFLSGDWIPLPLPDLVRASFPGARVVSLGGATEATVWSNWFPVETVDPRWASIPYGRPLQNARYHVLDPNLFPCPVGVEGDLYIAGECLSAGYAHAPALTADGFRPDPFSLEPGARCYRTGDRARYWPDGNLEFLGRRDHQVKIRGFRIELGEIEAVLCRHPGVREAIVLVREDAPGRRRLVAYCIPRIPGDEAPAATDLRRYLQTKLPDYMVPAAFVSLTAFPVTLNGKLDRAALPAPDDDAGPRRQPVPPRTPLESRIAALWTAVLGRESLSVHDNFFELGGDSLLAIQLIARLRDAFQIDLPLRGLFDAPTIAGLAGVLGEGGLAGAGDWQRGGEGGRSAHEGAEHGQSALSQHSATTLVPAPHLRHEPFPLTDLQQAYWLGQRADFDLGGMSAHIYQERELADLDVPRLEAAWRRLVDRHPMLRAVVLPDGRQRVLEEVPPLRLGVLDLRGLDPSGAEREILAVRRRMVDHGPATGSWPLFEVRLTRLDDRRWRLHVGISLLICDAVGLNVLQRELYRLYADPRTELVPLELDYRDYVVTMAEAEGSDGFARSRDYWLERLATLPPAPELPLLATRAAGGARFVQHAWQMEPAAWGRFRARAASAGVTPTAAILAAYARVLAAWSKSPRFTVNVLFFNRLPVHPQVNRVVGNFSSTLLVEVDAGGAESFQRRVQSLQERLWQDLEHSRFSGVRVLREIARRQGGTSRPVMPVVFTSDINLVPEDAASAEAAAETSSGFFWGALQTPQVWLDHQASEHAGRLFLTWQVVEGLFPDGMVEAMFAAYCRLVERLGAEEDAGEDAWGADPAVPPPAEQLALMAEANATAAPIAPAPLHAAFAEMARRRPDAPAVVAGGRTVTYGELTRGAGRLAARLRELGAGPGELVAVVLEKGWEQAAAVLAVAGAGAAYLPVDPALPRDRFRHLLTAGRAGLALTRPELDGRLDWPEGVRRLAVDASCLEAGDGAPPLPESGDPEELAYVIFTSGSTGLPKGVMIEHRGAWNTVADVNGRFGVGPDDRVLALSALSFDLSVYDLFGPLSAGGAVVVPGPDDLREPARWAELLEREKVTVWDSVPALMEMLVDHLEGRGERLPASLRLVLLSGDWIPVSLPGRIHRLAADPAALRIVGLGGATEASIWSILYPIERVDPSWTSIPYGRPMANQAFHVLDAGLRPRPVWVPGDLYIGGLGVARGYWGDEEKTCASFLRHPDTGERLYRTGDLGRYLPDGTLEFLGREDLQVKVQGYRIELGEIEAVLLAQPAVRAAVAAAVGPRRGAKRLVAYVVPAAGGELELEVEELRAALAARLPAYMVPTSWVRLDELPLTANGKVDRQALPDPDEARAGHGAPVPPRDEMEQTLARIWEEVLGLPPASASVRADFFEAGGHSLLAVRLMGRIQAELGRELPLSTLFAAPTVEALAGLLRQAPSEAGRPALVEVQLGGRGLPFFCVHPVGGNVLCYRDLARELGTGQPFYALQTPDPAPPSVEEMAAAYLRELRQVQPRGPYRLGGWSMGGVVAYEMARQLERAGEEVALLAMIDPWTPAPGDPTPAGNAGNAGNAGVDDAVLASWFLGDLGGLTGVTLAIDPEELRPLDPGARAALLLERARDAHVLPPDFGLAELSRHLEAFQRNFRALLDYVPGSYAGRPLLLLAADGGAAGQAVEAWTRFAGNAEVRLLPGDHYTLVRPPRVEEVAAELARELATDGVAGDPGGGVSGLEALR